MNPLTKAGRPWVRLTVEDHGAGIPGEVQERIFDPLFTTKGRDKGTRFHTDLPAAPDV